MIMKMPDVKKKAQAMGLKLPRSITKAELIRTIQKAEGNTPCFDSGVVACPYLDCCFRDDCQC
jgi:hypothetical protein